MSFNNLKNFLGIITFCCLGILIYSNIFQSPFVFDDLPSIVENQSIRNLGDLQSIWNFAPTHFITYFSLAGNFYIHQLWVPGYHLINLVIHLVSTILVWWFVHLSFSTPVMKDKEISRHAGVIAFFSALIFVAHPIQTQAVTYIIQRAASLATLFYIGSLNLYIKARVSKDKKPWRFYYGLSLIAAILGMFTKQIIFTLPLMITLFEFCFLRKGKKLQWKYLVAFLVLLLIVPLNVAAAKKVDLWQIDQLTKESEIISRGHYLLTQFRVLITYLRLLFIPLHQNLDYDHPISETLWKIPVFASLCFLVFILIIGILLFRRYRLISFAIFWFFLTLSVESGMVPIRDVIFEHRLYLPMLGYNLFLPTAIFYVCKNKKIGVIILLIVAGCYSFLAYTRNRVWKSELVLWNDTVHKSPKKARPYNNRGNAYFNKGEYDRAMIDFNQALKINPNYADAYYNRANIYFYKQEYGKAIFDYNQALKVNPNYAKAYNNRGNTYFYKGEYDKAISDFNQALKINPRFARAYVNRGNTHLNKKEYDGAISDYNQALWINPKFAEAYYNRAVVYYVKQDYKKAWEDICKAKGLGIKIDSKFIEKLQDVSESPSNP